MNLDEFRQLIHIVHGEYKDNYGTRAAMLAFERIKDCTSAQLGRAVDKVVTAHTHLPPIDRIVTATLAEQEKDKQSAIIEREDLAAKEKREMQQGTYKAFNKDTAAIARDSLTLIRAMCERRITRATALDGFRHLDALYPAAGFATEGAKLEKYYNMRKLAINEKIGEEP